MAPEGGLVASLRVSLLGLPRLEAEGAPLDVSSRKAVALLAYLAVAGEQSRDGLATLLWPESDRTRARAALRKALSVVNGQLGARWLVSGRSEVSLSDGVHVDVHAFRHALRRVEAHDHAPGTSCDSCLDLLTAAADMYRDDFLAGFGVRGSATFDDWQLQVTEELRHELTIALDQLIDAHAGRGAFDAAIGYANRRLVADPLHEPTHQRLVLLHAWNGSRAEAVRQYERCAQLLERELGVDPMPETTEAYHAVLAGHPPIAPTPAISEPVQPSRGSPLVGRSTDLNHLLQAHVNAASQGRVVVVEGEAGVGRTALLESAIGDLRQQGAAVVFLRCRETEQSLPYALVADAVRHVAATSGPGLDDIPGAWLAEAARLVPDLLEERPQLVAAPAVDAAETRRRLLEGIRRTLLGGIAGPVPGVIVVDDLQWADGPSLESLLYVADRLATHPCCVILAWRTEAVPDGHPARRLIAGLQGRGLAEVVRLARLGRDDIAELVANAGREDPDGTLADRLHQETQGLPLLVTELLRSLPDGPIDHDHWRFPVGAKELMRARMDGISEQAHAVAVTAAVIGHPFGLATLRRAGGLSTEEATAALDELLTANVLRDQADVAPGMPLTYEFQFEPLRRLVYQDISQTRRRLLHSHVADALMEGSSVLTLAGHAVVAEHLRQAGRHGDAASAFVHAARAAQQVAAVDEAAEHLRSALALGHPDKASLQHLLGELETLRGDYPAALRALRAAAGDMSAPSDQARLELDTARIHERRGDWTAAERHLQRGLEHVTHGHGSQPDSHPIKARLMAELALTAHRQNNAVEAHRRGHQALQLAEAADDPWATALAHNTLGVVHRAEESLDQAVEHLERAQQLAEDLDDPAASVAALNNLALTHADRGERSRALELAKTALARCRRRGDRHREAALLNNLADLLEAAGRHEEARAHVAEAVTLFADIDRPDHLEPEIWKLVDW